MRVWRGYLHGEGVWVHDERINASGYGVENIQWLFG